MKTFLFIYIVVAFLIVTLGWVWVWKRKYEDEDANLFFFLVGITWPVTFAAICTCIFGLGIVLIVKNMIDTIREK